MIHVLTAHFRSAEWIPIQRRYLDRFVHEPFRVVGSLDRVPDGYEDAFDEIVPSVGGHAGKLNLMARVVMDQADDDDLLLFLDGDAFPIGDVIPAVRTLLEDHALAAVCRTENLGDRQPHPSFCAVPVSTWRQLQGDWSAGWCFAPGHSDVGANLLYRLESTSTPWAPILRSNVVDLHPVLFGVYGDLVYHHGAGFRIGKVTRGDPQTGPRGPGRDRRAERLERSRQNAELSDQVLEQIRTDPDFYRQFL